MIFAADDRIGRVTEQICIHKADMTAQKDVFVPQCLIQMFPDIRQCIGFQLLFHRERLGIVTVGSPQYIFTFLWQSALYGTPLSSDRVRIARI